jgi:hypothetical protein
MRVTVWLCHILQVEVHPPIRAETVLSCARVHVVSQATWYHIDCVTHRGCVTFCNWWYTFVRVLDGGDMCTCTCRCSGGVGHADYTDYRLHCGGATFCKLRYGLSCVLKRCSARSTKTKPLSKDEAAMFMDIRSCMPFVGPTAAVASSDGKGSPAGGAAQSTRNRSRYTMTQTEQTFVIGQSASFLGTADDTPTPKWFEKMIGSWVDAGKVSSRGSAEGCRSVVRRSVQARKDARERMARR